MEISKKTKIGNLLNSYPFLIEYLVTQAPAFSKLKNPIMRKTVAAIASIDKAASLGGLDPDDLLAGIAVEIFKHTNESVTLVNSGGRDELPDPMDRDARIQAFKSIVLRIHGGEPVENLRDEFHQLLKDVSPAEVGAMEQELVADGIPESEIKKLCTLHVELFTADSDAPKLPPFPEGHPIHTFQTENAMAEEKAAALFKITGTIVDDFGYSAAKEGLKQATEDLSNIIRHYERKENQLFPMMEAHGLTAPPKVMWELHDDIRVMFKDAFEKLESGGHSAAVSAVSELTIAVRDMIFKEERILLPMVFEAFTEKEWGRVRRGEAEIGFSWIDPGDAWLSTTDTPESNASAASGLISLEAGQLEPSVLNAILKHLPVDMTFVGPDDRVAYFSQTDERIFPRSEGIIGRHVSNCHPPKSVHVVEEILEKFKSGERDTAEFWIELGGQFIHIHYFAVWQNGEYLGCLEVSQDATGIRRLEGEQRLLDWH